MSESIQLKRSYQKSSLKLVDKIQFKSKMFHSNIVSRLNHLYLIKTWLDIQKHCEKLYTGFMHKLLILVSKRLFRLNRLRKSKLQQQQGDNDTCYFNQTYNCSGADDEHSGATNIFQDLNNLMVEHYNNQTNPATAVSIPMQMLLLPIVVQQPSDPRRDPVAPQPNHQYMTLVAPGQFTMQPLQHKQQHFDDYMKQRQKSQIQFKSQQLPLNQNRPTNLTTNNWSANVALRGRASESAKLHSHGLIMRNPLLSSSYTENRRDI